MIQEIYDKQKVYEMGLDAIAYQDKDKLIQKNIKTYYLF